MLDDIVGNYGSRLFLAAGGVGLALLVLVGVLWLMRNRAPSPFVRGGKNRQPRLQVLDAAAVDARRRLVLVRRDGVEHLIMIGGPTDIVIESGIGDPSKIAAALPPQPVALETLPAPEQRIPQRLEPAREPQRVIARQPPAEQQLPPPPARTAIEPPLAPLPEKRPSAPPAASVPPVATPPPAVAIVTPPPAAAIVTPPPTVERPPAPPSAPAAVASEPPSAPPVVENREVAAAVDILEAARQRVMPVQPPESPQKAAEPQRPPVAAPQTPILVQDAYRESTIESAVIEREVPSAAPSKPVGDFESVLEAEMNSNLAAERVAPPPQSPAPTERRDPEMIGFVDRDALLQDEVARIFGEISVKRDK